MQRVFEPYPWWLADSGAFDILGTPNAEADWAKATWHTTDKPLINVQPMNHDKKPIKGVWRGTNGIASYSWKGCEGKDAVVEVFFDAAKVDLLQNGQKIKTAKVKDKRAKFKIKYVPGKLEAVAYDESGNEIGRNELISAGNSLRVCLEAEDKKVNAGDLVYVDVTIRDEKGIIESSADRKLKIEVENGELVAFGSANPRTEEDIHSGEYTTYYGRALAVIRAAKQGKIIVKTEDAVETVTVE